ncbi:unnamed protein product [Caretta caretta]
MGCTSTVRILGTPVGQMLRLRVIDSKNNSLSSTDKHPLLGHINQWNLAKDNIGDNESVLFPHKIATDQQSMVLVKRLLAISVSCITYLRGLFPESSYGTRYLDDLCLKILREDKSCLGSLQIVKWRFLYNTSLTLQDKYHSCQLTQAQLKSKNRLNFGVVNKVIPADLMCLGAGRAEEPGDPDPSLPPQAGGRAPGRSAPCPVARFQGEVSEKQHLKLAGTKNGHLLPITICFYYYGKKILKVL